MVETLFSKALIKVKEDYLSSRFLYFLPFCIRYLLAIFFVLSGDLLSEKKNRKGKGNSVQIWERALHFLFPPQILGPHTTLIGKLLYEKFQGMGARCCLNHCFGWIRLGLAKVSSCPIWFNIESGLQYLCLVCLFFFGIRFVLCLKYFKFRVFIILKNKKNLLWCWSLGFGLGRLQIIDFHNLNEVGRI